MWRGLRHRDWEFKGPGLVELMDQGVVRGFWDQAFRESVSGAVGRVQ